jgi:hypothetical protein
LPKGQRKGERTVNDRLDPIDAAKLAPVGMEHALSRRLRGVDRLDVDEQVVAIRTRDREFDVGLLHCGTAALLGLVINPRISAREFGCGDLLGRRREG